MKQVSRVLIVLLALGSMLISACGAATPAAGKVAADEVAFTGVIEGMDGTQWVVNGQTITVDPSVVRDGPFNVGDTIKIEGIVNSDGSLTVSRVESATQDDLSTLPQLGNDNSNDVNANDDNSNDVNANDDNSNDDDNVNDDNSNDDDANVNDDNDNDDNGNDDDSGNVNVNDDDSNDDNSNDSGGSGNSNDHGGGDDDSGGSGGDDDDSGDDD